MVFPEGYTTIDSDSKIRDAYDYLAAGSYTMSFKLFSDLAEAGYEEARYVTAFHYANGKGVVKDAKKAFQMWKQSADAGFIPAISEVAQCFAYGFGVKTDDSKAFDLFSIAAEAGDPYAMGMLSLMYHNGDGVRRDHRKAEEWTERCEEAADISEVEDRGLELLTAGNGALARMFLYRSAMMGSPISAKALFIMFSNGLGVHVDEDEASDWDSTAEDMGWDEVTKEDLDDYLEWFSGYVSVDELED